MLRMNPLEKFNRTFGTWYEGLFGGSDDVRPKDILRRILAAMEDNRKEGFDNKVYVPNQYILEINVHDEEEKEYLLSFLNKEELDAAVRRYCQQNHYHIKGGALDFTIKEVESTDDNPDKRQEKVRVRCRYDSKVTAPDPPKASVNRVTPELDREDRTVPRVAPVYEEEMGTVPSVAAAALVVYAPDRPPFRYAIARGAVTIGRSPRTGNDLVIESDGQLSKRHARIELEADGQFTLYDLNSTNGTRVNGKRIQNRTLHNGDEILMGESRLMFQQAPAGSSEAFLSDEDATRPSAGAVGRSQGTYGGAAASLEDGQGSSSPPARVLRSRTARLVLSDGAHDVDDYLLGSETTIGRGVTNDIVLPDRSIATRHARIVNDGDGYRLECLSEGNLTTLNSAQLPPRQPMTLHDGDRIGLGSLALRFESGG